MTLRMLASAVLAAVLAAALAAPLATPAAAQGSAARHGLADSTDVMLPEISVTYHRPAPANRFAAPHAGGTADRLTR